MEKYKTINGTYIENLYGQRFGKLTVIDYPTKKAKDKRWMWVCKCDCGTICEVSAKALKSKTKKSCGCLKREYIPKYKNLTGLKFGRLTVIKDLHKRNNDKRPMWLCRCDCGNECEVSSKALTSGHTKSCGCIRKEMLIKRNKENTIDLTGHTQGKITILYKIEDDTRPETMWHCRCSCGNEFDAPLGELRRSEYGDKKRKGIFNCPECSVKSLGEKRISDLLKKLNIIYQKEKVFKNCKDISYLRFDFYLPDYNCCIEYDGEHHFGDRNGGYITEEFVENIKNHDKIKNNYCKDNSIKLIRIPYYDFNKLTEDYLKELING